MNYLWQTFLYRPLLNALMWLYSGPARENLGIALIELTVGLRIILLPLTILAIQARTRYDKLRHEIHSIEVTHKNDTVRSKEAMRGLLSTNHINPWAKAGLLGIQFVVLIILYRVFVGAIRHNDFTGLYSWNSAPDFLNRMFLGFDLSVRSAWWAGGVAVLLYLELWFEQRKHRGTLTNSDVMYRLLFPLATFAVLYLLPAGKSVFVLTSVLFTVMVDVLHKLFVRPKPVET